MRIRNQISESMVVTDAFARYVSISRCMLERLSSFSGWSWFFRSPRLLPVAFGLSFLLSIVRVLCRWCGLLFPGLVCLCLCFLLLCAPFPRSFPATPRGFSCVLRWLSCPPILRASALLLRRRFLVPVDALGVCGPLVFPLGAFVFPSSSPPPSLSSGLPCFQWAIVH